MSAELGHNECRESLAAYALGALPAEEAELVERHLLTCQECRAQLEYLRPAVDALPASVTQVEAPPELRARVMRVVEGEAELLRAAGGQADRPKPEPGRPRRIPTRGWIIGVGLAAACVVALVIALVVTSAGPATRTLTAQVTNPALAGAHVTLQVRGSRAQLVVRNLPTPPANHVDQLWIRASRGGAPVSAGTFVLESGAVSLSRPVRSGDQVLMTVEPGRGSPGPTTTPLLVVLV